MHGDRLDAVEMRRARIQRVLGIINSVDEIEYGKGLAMVCYNLGISESKVREYFKILKDAGRIRIKDGFIRSIVSKKAGDEKEADELLKEVTKASVSKKEGKHGKR